MCTEFGGRLYSVVLLMYFTVHAFMLVSPTMDPDISDATVKIVMSY